MQRIENQAFDDMVQEILLQQEYRRRGITVSDAELRDFARFAPPSWITSAPELQTDGQFDQAKYQRLLASGQARQSGLLVALEQYYRAELPKRKLAEQVTAGVFATDLDLWRAWQDANDSASVSFVAFRPTPTAADSNVSDADLRNYYDAHKEEFDRAGRAVWYGKWRQGPLKEEYTVPQWLPTGCGPAWSRRSAVTPIFAEFPVCW